MTLNIFHVDNAVVQQQQQVIEEDACLGPSCNKKAKKAKKTVSFGNVHVRQYALCIGDHPMCSRGFPLSLSWEHAMQDVVLPVDQYDTTDRRRGEELRMTHYERKNKLKRVMGMTETQLLRKSKRSSSSLALHQQQQQESLCSVQAR
mmetsp:Transcript_31920/g.48823  ORF Transcript_31920/g.48823 Transcript_31920/m.48823 type:complete len:147 (-) Transcript_31920:220-660(-)